MHAKPLGNLIKISGKSKCLTLENVANINTKHAKYDFFCLTIITYYWKFSYFFFLLWG